MILDCEIELSTILWSY